MNLPEEFQDLYLSTIFGKNQMPDYTSDSNSSNIDSMLGAFFGNVSHRAFGRMGAGIETLENKFKQLGSVAQSRTGTLRTGAERFSEAVQSINRGLREQANRIRGMPPLRQPSLQTFPIGRGMPSQPKHHSYSQPRGEDGRYLPGQGRGGRGGGSRGFGGTRFASRFSPGAGGFGGISAFGGLGSVGVLFGGASAARGFGRFDANLATLQAEAGLDTEQRKDVTGQILDIAGSTQFDTQQVSSTLIAMVKDGIELNQALEQVPNVLRLAVAESTDLESAWSAMRGFVQSTNSEWSDSVRLSDMMSNATSLSAAKLADLQDIASRGLTAHSSLDAFSTEGFLAITGILKSLNISNEVIGTGMRQFGTTIARATEGGLDPKAMAQLQARGIQFERGMTEIEALKELQQGVQGMADTELKNFFHDVFGERAKKVFENVIPKVDELAEKMEQIRKKGTVNEEFEVHAKSLTNQMKLLTSAGDSLIKKFIMILNEGEAFGGGIGWVTGKITQLTGFMEENKDTIQAWWGNFREVMGGLFNLVATGIEKAASFWAGLSEGEKTIVAIGAVIGAFVLGPVTGLIAAGALIVAKWDEIKDFFAKLWDGMDEPVLGFVKTVRDGTMGVVNWVRRQWDELSPFFARVWRGIRDGASSAWGWIRDNVGPVVEVVLSVWEPVGAILGVAFEVVKTVAAAAWWAIKTGVKGTVDWISTHWEALKTIFAWSPIGIVLRAFKGLIELFADIIRRIKSPLESFFGWIAEKFDWLRDRIADIRSWFTRGEDGKMTVSVALEEPEALKVDLPAAVLPKPQEPPTDASETQKAAPKTPEATHYESYADTSGKASGIPKPVASGFEAYAAADAEERRATARRRADAGLGKMEDRAMRTAPKREFTSEINRDYTSREQIEAMRADKETLARRADETQRFGTDRKSLLAEAHAFGGKRADLSRVKLFDRLQHEFPKLFEKFYAPDVEKSPVIPEVVLSGDDRAFDQWTRKLTGRMERQEARQKTPTTRTALGGFDKGGITADRLLNRERYKKEAVETLEATKIIRFPSLDPEQARELGDVFRSGFIALSDINSAILAEMQTQTRLLGGTVDTSMPIVRPQSDSAFDDTIVKRLTATQEMAGVIAKDTPIPEVRSVVSVEPLPTPAIKEATPPALPKPQTDSASVVVTQDPVVFTQPQPIEPTTPPAIRPIVNVETVEPLATAPKPPTVPQETSGLGTENKLEMPTPPIAESGVPSVTVNLEQPAGLKDLRLPEFELPVSPPKVQTASPAFSVDAPSVSVTVPNVESAAATPAPALAELPIVTPEVQDVAAPHAPVIQPQLDTRFENLLESGLRIADADGREGERVTPTGQRVEIADNRASGTGNITIEKIEIHADSDKSARDIAKAVLEEFNRMQRERNF